MADMQKDTLTGLPSKQAFDELLQELIPTSVGETPVSLAFFDVDQFLGVNERYGRDSGDRVLVALASVFRKHFADHGSSTYRIGGDEFAVLVPEVEKERMFLRLEAARHEFADLEEFGFIDPHPTVSIGLATYPDDGSTRQEIIRKADDALFRAKMSGRNRVTLASEEKKVPKTSHYTQGQLDRLSALSDKEGVGEAELLREALDDLLKKYSS